MRVLRSKEETQDLLKQRPARWTLPEKRNAVSARKKDEENEQSETL